MGSAAVGGDRCELAVGRTPRSWVRGGACAMGAQGGWQRGECVCEGCVKVCKCAARHKRRVEGSEGAGRRKARRCQLCTRKSTSTTSRQAVQQASERRVHTLQLPTSLSAPGSSASCPPHRCCRPGLRGTLTLSLHVNPALCCSKQASCCSCDWTRSAQLAPGYAARLSRLDATSVLEVPRLCVRVELGLVSCSLLIASMHRLTLPNKLDTDTQPRTFSISKLASAVWTAPQRHCPES